MKKNSYFSYLFTSTVIRQTESILLKVGPPPLEKFSGSAPVGIYQNVEYKKASTGIYWSIIGSDGFTLAAYSSFSKIRNQTSLDLKKKKSNTIIITLRKTNS